MREFFARDKSKIESDFQRLSNAYISQIPIGEDSEAEISSFQAELEDFGKRLTRDIGLDPVADVMRLANQPEELLDDVVACIERCLGDKALYDCLSLELMNLSLELYEATVIDSIAEVERQSDNVWNADEKRADLERRSRELLTKSDAPEGSPISSDTVSGLLIETMNYAKSQINSGWFKDKASARSWEHSAREGAAAASQAKSSEEANRLLAQSFDILKQKSEGLRLSAEAKLDLQKSLLAFRADETTRAGSILNYRERILQVIERAARDFEEALKKSHAIRAGMIGVLNLDCEDVEPRNWARPLDELITWVRSANGKLRESRMNRQRSVARFSLLELLDNENFYSGEECKFRVPASALPPDSRLVGLSAALDGSSEGFVAIEIVVPEQEVSDIVQLPALTVYMGRILSAGTGFEPDIYGRPQIVNRSWIGDWRVRLVSQSGDSMDDRGVNLDLHVEY